MHRQELLQLLKGYKTRFMDELAFVNRSIAFVEQHTEVFYRELHPAHVTGSAWVVNPERSRVLMMHHKKLDQWFQPGGHADGDADIVRVALKETSEETGIDLSEIKLVDSGIFDVDIHTIPARGADPEHEHIDIRFLIEIDDRIPVPGNIESHEVLWIELQNVSRYNRNRSTYRMLEKTRAMRNSMTRRLAGGNK
jgi:8-oxo-dGTP pyrophosphatase MutT (NUDIX family)